MMNLRSKVLFGFGSLLSVLVVVSLLSIVVITWYTHAIERVLHENYDSVVFGQKMREAVDALSIQAQNVVYGGASQDAGFVKKQSDAVKLFNDNLESERGNITLPGEGELEEKVREDWGRFAGRLHETLAVGASEGEKRAAYGELMQERDGVSDAAQKIIDMNLENMVSVNGKAKAWASWSRGALYVLLAAGIVIGSVVIVLAGRWILRPLQMLTQSVREIEGGNLNLVVQAKSHDEVGELAEAFNSMTAKLREFRRTDQAKLLRTQQTTQLAIDSLPDGVAVISPDGVIEMANGTGVRLFGLKPEMAVEGLKQEWLVDLFEEVRDQLRAHEPHGYQSALQIFDNGTEKFFLPQGVPILDARHRLVGVTLVLIDVTRLRRLDEMKSSLVATVSHELRTPLTSIRLANHLLLSDRIGGLNQKQTDVVMESRDNADRLQRIIENLLDMSRIESGRGPLELAEVRPHELVVEATDQVRSGMQEKGIDLEVDVGVDLPRVSADKVRIGHVLVNLLTNAQRYTAAGGRIVVRAVEENGMVVFSVSDTGKGIPAEYLGRVFERFFRVPGQASHGVGLGLAIAKEIVLAHGGAMSVQSGESNGDGKGGGGGTTFRFTLPVVKSAALAESAV